MKTVDFDVDTTVLRCIISNDEATDIINQKKNSLFGSLLSRPNDEDVSIYSTTLYYEGVLVVSGRYKADYFKSATHSISVDSNVKEVILSGTAFPVRTKSRLSKALGGDKRRNKIDLTLNEHVFIDQEDKLTFDTFGEVIQYPFKIDSGTIESYPKQILEENKLNIRKLEISPTRAVTKLESQLKRSVDIDIWNLNEEFTIHKVSEIYIPVFEARIVGPKQQASIIRLDAARKKII